jgi:hypothetical protein
MRRRRVRFLIWLTAMGVLYAAALLAFRVYINPYSSWRHFAVGATMAVAFTLIMNLLTLALVLGRWSARCFALGFVLGAVLENTAMGYYTTHNLLRFIPGTWAPEGWYPLAVPLERVLIERGWQSIGAPPLSAAFAGMALSGILCGVLLMVVGESLRRVTKRKRTSLKGDAVDGKERTS